MPAYRWNGINKAIPLLAPLVLGAAIFLLFFGMRPLDVTNFTWRGEHWDPFQAWLGWHFYRIAPWGIPPGASLLYGFGLNNSIVYTDSIPLLAIPLKLLSPLLPNYFQYQGWWLLACFMGQCAMAWKLIGLYTSSIYVKLLGAALFCFSPIWLHRLDCHHTLAGQCLILAALYLCLAPPQPKYNGWWIALLCLAIAVHAYLFIMVGALWASSMARALFSRRISFGHCLLYAASAIFSVLCVMWFCGYFTITPGGQGGFGLYKMNLLGFLDSDGFSLFAPDMPNNPGEGEGYSYLGAGVFLLLICALPALRAHKLRVKALARKHWPLLLALAALLAFAITYKIGIGTWNITLWHPARLDDYLNGYFRASGRFVWPIVYLIALAAIAIIARYYTPKKAALILAAGLLLQAADTWPKWSGFREMRNPGPEEQQSLSDFWNNPGIKSIMSVPIYNCPDGWDKIGVMAAKRGMPVNYFYLSRFDVKRAAEAAAAGEMAIMSQNPPEGVVYIVVSEDVYRKALADPGDMFVGKVDGFRVIANPKTLEGGK